jgi:type I restriction enzyme S subunit
VTTVPLKSLCQTRHGGTPSKTNAAYWVGSIPWVSPKDMKSATLSDASDHISQEAVENSATSVVPEKSILVVVRSGILAHSLPVAQAAKPLAFNQDIKALTPDVAKVDPDYLFWFIRSQEPRVLAQGVQKGATVHSLQSGFIENLQVPLPERAEQRRIVDLLSRAEGIVRLRREAEKKAAELIPALFLDMFGDPATNPKGWKSGKFSDVVADVRNGFNPSKDQFGSGTRFITVNGLYNGLTIDTSSADRVSQEPTAIAKYRLHRGDLCFVRSSVKRAGVGMASVFDSNEEAVFGGFVIRAQLTDVLLPMFACAMFHVPSVRKIVVENAGTGTITNINQPALLSVPIIEPPLELQQDFALKVQQAASIQTQQSAATTKAQATFDALLANVFDNRGTS